MSIKGRLGGVYFTRDATGQHVQAMPRTLNRGATGPQREQRNWYAAKKGEERKGGPPLEKYELPKDHRTALIFSLEVLWADRQPSLTAPVQTEVETAGFYPDAIRHWINVFWTPALLEWGLTKPIMELMMLKWFWIAKGTFGGSGAVALAAAKANMLNWISTVAAATAVPLLAAWLGLIGMGFYFKFLEWLEAQHGHVSFKKGRVLILHHDSLEWGNLLSRPTTHMYDFVACAPTDFGAFSWSRIADTPSHQLHFLSLKGLWQTVSRRFLWWYVYTWTTIRCRWRGVAYLIGPHHYRMYCEPDQIEYWGHPIGWTWTESPPCWYLSVFDDYFEYHNHPQPPL